jgi:hypothetical protein
MRIFQSLEWDYTHDKITAMFKSSRKTRGLSRGLQQIVLHSRRPGIPHNSLTLRNVIKNPEKEGRKWDIPLISRIMQPFCQRFLKRFASIAPWGRCHRVRCGTLQKPQVRWSTLMSISTERYFQCIFCNTIKRHEEEITFFLQLFRELFL